MSDNARDIKAGLHCSSLLPLAGSPPGPDLLEGRGQHGGELARPGDSTAGHWVSHATYSSLGPTEPQLHL